MRRISTLSWCLIGCAALTPLCRAQLPLTAADAAKVAPLIAASSPNSLKCRVEQWRPFLDFALRFQTGYVVHCRLAVFEGKKASVLTYLRVTPEGKQPVLLGTFDVVPAIPPDMPAAKNTGLLKQEIWMSGSFNLGEGRYSVEIMVIDDRGRTCRRHWKLRAAADRSQRNIDLEIQPLVVQSFDRSAWRIDPPQPRAHLRLTVFLDAAPINPYQSSLRAWDRAFLLECVYSLLRRVPYKSVRLVAFNLDQQREIFRRESFDDQGFSDLGHALREVETSSISVQALKNRNSPRFLTTLVNRELASADSSDAFIFLGPNARLDAHSGTDLMSSWKPGSTPFFYFEYFPWANSNFPDAIQWLIKATDGKTFQIHSPAQLGQSIQKMLAQLKQE